MAFQIERHLTFKPVRIVFILILINFLIRVSIYYTTKIFYFSDYSAYLNEIERIGINSNYYFLVDNYLLGISYLGYFARSILGSLDYFFIFNCFLASLAGLIIYFIINKVFRSPLAGIIALIISTFYTEFMVFSSVFYSQVIMIFLLSLFILLLFIFLKEKRFIQQVVITIGIIIVFLLSFFFKLEFKFIPYFLLASALIFIRIDKSYVSTLAVLSFVLIISCVVFNKAKIVSQPPGNVISNEFNFFGHTNYGGDGGEGSFVYHENEVRYYKALAEWCEKNKIIKPDAKDINRFQSDEIIKFVTGSPFAWIKLQLTKFFRTFGVVPETTSFKVLYTGLLKNNLWLTAIVVVAPVALIILMFIIFFNFSAIKQLFNSSTLSTLQPASSRSVFLIIYMTLFIYYIIATIFFGQYQERYRMPVMVVFVIPVLSYFMATFDKKQFFNRVSLSIKGGVIVMFLVIWMFQAKKAISNKERLENAIESVKGAVK